MATHRAESPSHQPAGRQPLILRMYSYSTKEKPALCRGLPSSSLPCVGRDEDRPSEVSAGPHQFSQQRIHPPLNPAFTLPLSLSDLPTAVCRVPCFRQVSGGQPKHSPAPRRRSAPSASHGIATLFLVDSTRSFLALFTRRAAKIV